MWSSSLPFTIILLTGALMCFLLAFYVVRQRRSEIVVPFVGFMICAGLYAFGYALELAQVDLGGIMIWSRVQYLGISFLPPFWTLLAFRFAGKQKWLTRRLIFLMFALSLATLIINVTNPLHNFYYRSLGLVSDGHFPLLVIGKGVWYWVYQIYMNIALVAGFLAVWDRFRRGTPAFRWQAGLMLLAGCLPWGAYLLYIAGFSPYGIDLSPFGLALMGPFLALALFRYRFLDIIPVARDAVFMGMADGVVVLDASNRIVDFNSAAGVLFPVLDRDFIGRHVSEALGRFPSILDLLRTETTLETEIVLESEKDPRHFRVRLSLLRSRSQRIMGRALLFDDSTEQVRLLEKLRVQATIDDLTGIFNRRHFIEQAKREAARSKRRGHALSVIVADLDHFKGINDTFGHEIGDRALRALCDRFQEILRTADILGRHGGEEFLVLLPETPPDQAVLVAERLRASLSAAELDVGQGKTVSLAASFGVAGVERVGEEEIEDLIRAADRAMYQAKSAGRDCVRLGVLPSGR
jgi:diguanylate cyclase (GGDEF)-like protein